MDSFRGSDREDLLGDDTLQLGEGAAGYEPDELCLVIAFGGSFETIPLHKEQISIGRSRDNDVRIEDPSISRHHALLRCKPTLAIKDCGSRNGITIRGRRVAAGGLAGLQVGDLVELGAVMVLVRPVSSMQRPRRIWPHEYFNGRLEEECTRRQRSGGSFAVVRLAFAEAPPPLAEAALIEALRRMDVLASYAPGEYEVLLCDTSAEHAEAAAARIVESMVAAGAVRRDELRVGITCFPRDGRSAEVLLAHSCETVRRGAAPGSPALKLAYASPELRAQITQIAASDLSVLIAGETGVGKEVCAEVIHELSPRAPNRLLRINCAAFSETLLESELFGYERGAFTGAHAAKPGLLETANGGTVFLDELGDMPPATQVKLLRVLEDRTVLRIGGLEPRAIDVRFVAATNKDLEAEIAARRFRQDLYFRLNAFTIHVPPLRARRDEIGPLAQSFLSEATPPGRPAPELSAEALALLERYSWPGNVRELRNVIQRAIVLAGAGPIRPDHLPLDAMRTAVVPSMPRLSPPALDADLETFDPQPTMPFLRVDPRVREDAERQRIIDALDRFAGHQGKAARHLGISRGTLISRLDKYGLPRPRKSR